MMHLAMRVAVFVIGLLIGFALIISLTTGDPQWLRITAICAWAGLLMGAFRWRSVAVLLGAALLTLALGVVLMYVITPNKSQLIVRIFTTSPNSSHWPEISRQWNRVMFLDHYVITPLTGVIVGLFIGLLQKRYPVVLALLAPLPVRLFMLWSDRTNTLAMFHSSVPKFVLVNSIPFVSTAIAAWLFYRLSRSQSRDTRSLSVAASRT